MADVPYKVYKTGVQGTFDDKRTANFSFLPGSNTPSGYQESSLDEFNQIATSGQKTQFANDKGYQNLLAGTTNYATDPNGVLTTKTALGEQASQQQGIASGALQNIGTSQAPLTVPTGSAAAVNAQGGSYAQQAATPTAQMPGVVPVDPNLRQGFEAAKASGAPPPTGAGDAASAVQGFTNAAGQAPTFYKPDPNDPTLVNAKGERISYEQYKAQGGKGVMGQPNWTDVQNGPAPSSQGTPLTGIEQQLAVDPGYQQLLKDYAQYNSIEEKTKSLTDTYNEAIKSSGLEAINTELINAKNVIDGTEDDIRNEVAAASGFATDSQVMALAQARNKTLVKSYNKLVDQQSNIQNQVNTMVNLSSQDRQFALQSINQKLQIDQQINDYRDKFVNNAKEGYANYIKAVGYTGLYNSVAHDPQSLATVEKTLGLPSGTLAQAANQEAQALAKQDQKDTLDLQYKQAQIRNINSEISNRGATTALEKAKFEASLAKDQAAKTSTPLQQAQSKASIDQINNIISGKNLSSVVGPNAFSRVSDSSGFGGVVKNLLTGGLVRNALTPNRSNVVGDIEQIRSQLNLQALIDAKSKGATFGALSDQELQVLSSSATKLGTWAIKDKQGNVIGYNAREGDFKKELDKINNFAKLDYILKGGDPTEVGIQQMPDGTFWTTNSDGSVTKF